LVVKLLVLGLLAYLGWKAWGVLRGDAAGQRRGDWGPVRQLVRDPHCQAYVPEHTAERVTVGGKVLYFCSPECRRAYLRKVEGDNS